MIREASAGVVLFRVKGGRRLFLLLRYPSGHWDFVKGKIEPGESERAAAVREAAEETGITDVGFVDGYEERIEYEFQYEGRQVHKRVVFFLAETRTGAVTLSHEHLGHAWVGYDDAMRQTTFDNARRVLRRARERLGPEKRPGGGGRIRRSQH